MKKHFLFSALILCAVCEVFSGTALKPPVSSVSVAPKSSVSLKGKSIRLDYSLSKSGPISLEIIGLNGKTLGIWNWVDTASGTHQRDLTLNRAMENQSVFVVVNGPDLTSIQGLYTGEWGEATSMPPSISSSIPLNENLLPEDVGKGSENTSGFKSISPYGP